MLKNFKTIAALILATTGVAAVPATAQDIVVKAHRTFRDFEYAYNGNEAVDGANAALNARIPAGMATSAARAIVRKAGANCDDAVDNGQTRCTFTGFEAVDDQLHDVIWTVRLNSQDGRIAGLNVARESIGS